MKSILLTSTALVAFAGAAAADGHATPGVSFAGDATLGYNDDVEGGFYWDAGVDVTGTAALNNGIVATATFSLSVVENDLGEAVSTSDYVLMVEGGGSSLTFGDTDPVAEANWGGVDGATVADFNDQDVHFDVALFDAMLVGATEVAGITAMVSFGVDVNGDTIENELDAMQIYASGSFGTIDIEVAYQETFGPTPTIFGVSAGTTFAGADITVAYIDDETESSIGIAASYPVGPVTAGAYYSVNDIAEDNYGVSADYASGPISASLFGDYDGGTEEWDFGVEGSFDAGNGLTVLAGMIDSGDAFYVAGSLDLGGGATLLVSYAEDENNATNDEIGDPEYLHGSTVEVSFAF